MRVVLVALSLLGVATLAGCRESGLAAQYPATTGSQARVLRLDTTFLGLAQHNRAFRFTTALHVGYGSRTVAIPVEINWTAIDYHGCPQVASVQVYQLNGYNRRVALQATVRRDSTCRAGLGANGQLGTATTGMALVSVSGASRDVPFVTTTSCLLNALGYHDALSYDEVPPVASAATR